MRNNTKALQGYQLYTDDDDDDDIKWDYMILDEVRHIKSFVICKVCVLVVSCLETGAWYNVYAL